MENNRCLFDNISDLESYIKICKVLNYKIEILNYLIFIENKNISICLKYYKDNILDIQWCMLIANTRIVCYRKPFKQIFFDNVLPLLHKYKLENNES